MAALKELMHTISSQRVSNQWLESSCDKSGGLVMSGQYAWFASGANIVLYSKQLESVVSSRSFDGDQKDKFVKITVVRELYISKETNNFLLVGCSFKSFGILFVCQLPTLTTIRCIELPWPISYIDKIKNTLLIEDQLCDEFKIMSTILLVGMETGAVYAIDLRQNDIEMELKQNGVIVNETRPNKLLMIRKNEDCQEIKNMCDNTNCHLAMFMNEKFHTYCKKHYTNTSSVSCLIFIEEINTIAIGYSTGHFQLWDCKIKRTICSLEEPNCVMPITHISFLEPSDDPNNLCYLWIIQSDNSKLPNATMIGLNYKHRVIMPNGFSSYRTYAGNGIKLQVNLKKEFGVGRCISALTVCNMNLFRDENDIYEDSEIRLFSMLIEICRNQNDEPESFIFVFDINQWYKAQMPSVISHLKVSNMYASFVKLPYNAKYLDFNISDKTLRPFGYNFRNNIEELYYPSSMYFECDCLVTDEIIRFKHAGIQQEILDQLLLKSWKLLINPTLVFNQCLQTNLKPFFWDKTDDYVNYSLSDQRSFVISILVENKMMSVISACAEEWKNGTYISSEATILHLVQCLWKHVMAVKQYADKLCVSLFDYSGTQMDKKNQTILSYCLSQMQCVKNFLEYLCNAYGAHIINVDYSNRVFTLNLVTEYFKAVICFLNYGLLPESHENDPINHIQCDFTSLIQYADKRRASFGNLQLYLIDAIIYNHPKGNKLIEQWQHEGCEITKGLYPPSNIQCLLRIYLNAALTDTLKNYITIYFLIDVCSLLNLDIKIANRMCNFAVEFDVENKILNTLCRASWLFDHDMFEDAIKVLSNDNSWSKIESESWNWFHWTVLKLLVFKKEYFWAQFYMKLSNVELLNIEDQKFYINIQVMNNKCFDILNYMRTRPIDEKQIIFEYFFDKCKETKKLKSLIEYPFDFEEEELFLNYLKKFKDMESITFQLLFLLQRGRYLEAIEQKKLFGSMNKSKYSDALTVTNLLVSGFDKCTPDSIRKSFIRPPIKNLYKKTDVFLKYVSSDSKILNIIDRKKDTVKVMDECLELSNPINLIIPLTYDKKKRSSTYDVVPNLKRIKIDDVTSSPKVNDDSAKPIFGKQELEILNTPLVPKTVSQTMIKNYSSILKTGPVKKYKPKSSIKSDSSDSKTVLRFSLPYDNNIEPFEQNNIGENMEISQIDNESFYNCENGNDLVNTPLTESLGLNEFSEDHSKIESLVTFSTTDKKEIDQSEPMEISAEFEIGDVKNDNSQINPILSNNEDIQLISSSDEEKTEVKINTEVIPQKPTCSTYNKSQGTTQLLTSHNKSVKERVLIPKKTKETSYPRSNNTIFSSKKQTNKNANHKIESKSNDKTITVISLDSDTDSNCSVSVKKSASGPFNSNEEVDDESISSDDQLDDEQSIYSDEQSVDDVQSIYSDDQSVDDEQNVCSDEQSVDDEQNISADERPVNDEHSIYSDEQSVYDEQNISPDEQAVNDEQSIYSVEQSLDDIQSISSDAESINDDEYISLDMQPVNGAYNIHSNVQQVIDDKNVSSNMQPVNDDQYISSATRPVEDGQILISSDVQPVYDNQYISYVTQPVYDDQIMPSDEKAIDDGHNISFDVQPVNDNQNIYSDMQSINYDQNISSDVQPVNYNQNISFDVQPVNDDQNISSGMQSLNDDQNVSSDVQPIVDSQSDESDLEITRFGRFKSQNNRQDTEIEEDTDIIEEQICEEYDINVDDNDTDGIDNHASSSSISFNISSSKQNTGINLESNNENKDEVEEEIYKPHSMYDTINYSDNPTELVNSEQYVNLCKNPPTNDNGDGTELSYSILSNINSFDNPISCEFDYKESHHDNSINYVESQNDQHLEVENEINIDSNPSNKDNLKEAVECVHETNSTNILIYSEINNDETCNTQYKNVNDVETIQPNEKDFEISRNEFNPISCDDFKQQVMSGTEISQSENVEVNLVNQSTSFMFGKPFFGQQKILDNKPLLFGQIYTSEKDQIVMDSHNNELGTQNAISVDNHEEDIINNKSPEEKEIVDEMQDILELESLPESNPEENIDVPLTTNTNNLKLEKQESNKPACDSIQSPILLDNSKLLKNINSKVISEIETQNKQPLLQDVSEIKNPEIDKNSSLQNVIEDKEQLLTDKTSNNQNNRIIITRSRAKSVSSCQQVSNSLNPFRLYDDNNSRQIRVSLTKTKSKSQENISSTKRKRENSKSPINILTTKKLVFGLDKIPEEGSCSNSDKIIETKNIKNPKFNFLKNTSSVKKYDNIINLQDTRLKTPRKAKSLHSEPAATMSVMKNKSKRSSSVNLLLSDDDSVTENDDYLDVLKKALVPNTRKSSRVGSVPNRKKPKMITSQTSIDETESVSNESSITNESVTCYISPIEGDNTKHMLITPAKNLTKMPMKSLDSETDDSSSDESTNSKRLTRATVHNSNSLNIDFKPKDVSKPCGSKLLINSKRNKKQETKAQQSTPDRRVTRSQTLNLDNSLQSTSLIGHDQTEKDCALKSGKKKSVKQKKSIN